MPELKIPKDKEPTVRRWYAEDPALFGEIQTRYRERDAAIKAYNQQVHAHNKEVFDASGIDPETARLYLEREQP